jgi:hypothetical protein
MLVQNAKGAVVAARRLGYPVVLTPFAGRHSPIGCRNLHNEADVHDAFPDAARDSLSGRVIVARPAAGTVYRILVVGDRVAAVAERAPKHSTVQGQTAQAGLGTLATSADQTKAVLSTRDLILDDGVAECRVIPLALTGSRGSGGTTIDRTDEIHPRTAAIACHAAQVVGLAVAEDATLLARLDAAFFQVAEAHDLGCCKVYDPTVLSREGLREGLRRDGLDIERLEAGHRFRWCPEGDLGRGVAAVRQLLAEEAPAGRSLWVVLDWLGEPELELALRQQEQLADLVAAAPLVVATGVVEPEMADWPGADAQWRLLESLRGVVRYNRRGLLLSRVEAPPHL